MHGQDNIFIEGLWRSLKREAVYLEDLTDGFKAHPVIEGWMEFGNADRPHSALKHRTPNEAYWTYQDRKLAALKPERIYLKSTANLSGKPGTLQTAALCRQ